MKEEIIKFLVADGKVQVDYSPDGITVVSKRFTLEKAEEAAIDKMVAAEVAKVKALQTKVDKLNAALTETKAIGALK